MSSRQADFVIVGSGNALVIMVAEKAADMILDRLPMRAKDSAVPA